MSVLERRLGLSAGAALVVAAAWVAPACGGDAENQGGATGTSTTGTGGCTDCQGGGGAAAGGGGCGPSDPCGVGEYCDYSDDLCGAGVSGTCKPRPGACPAVDEPTCGCDGAVHGNACSANGDGTDVANSAGCQPPQGMFECGAGFCQHGGDYCQVSTSDVGGEPSSYGCKPLPAGCGATPTCGCVATEPCSSLCEVGPMGDVTLTCPGG